MWVDGRTDGWGDLCSNDINMDVECLCMKCALVLLCSCALVLLCSCALVLVSCESQQLFFTITVTAEDLAQIEPSIAGRQPNILLGYILIDGRPGHCFE
jgi:hypothetical protein